MRGMRRVVSVGAAVVLAVVGGAGPASSQASAGDPPAAYVVTASTPGCDLQEVDLATGALTDLPWGSDPASCVFDLAVAPDGTVYGVGFDHSGGGADARLVTFDAAGAPRWQLITVPGAATVGMADGGIAVSPVGTVHVDLIAPGVCDTTCLYVLDPETAAASLVGPGSQGDRYLQALSWCASGLITLLRPDSASVAMQWSSEDVATGLVTPGAHASEPVGGYDCQSTGAVVHAVSNRNGGAGPRPWLPSGPPARVGTVDLATGTFLSVAELTDPDADVLAFAVTPEPSPPPPAAPAVVAPADVVPAFTG